MDSHPTIDAGEVAWIDTATMREIDRVMVEELGIRLVQMMENAGRSLADLALARHRPTTVTVIAGPGGNGGGGLVAARHLTNLGVSVDVVLTTTPDRLADTTAHQLGIVERMGLTITSAGEPVAPLSDALVIDAMVGYSLDGPLRGPAAALADELSGADTPVLSLDVPSGVDATSGPRTGGPIVAADATLTLCLPKVGLGDAPQVGDLYLADISVPRSVTDALADGPAPPFDRGRILRVTLPSG